MDYSDLNSQTINDKYKPLSAWAYVGYQILFAIPVVNLILMIVFSCSNENINRRNLARSYLLALALFLIPVVIIISTALTIFTRLGTPDTANFARFCQDVDNIYSATLNSYADLKAQHMQANETRTNEQIYMEIATGKDPGEYASMDGNCENIDPSNNQLNRTTLPKVREHNEAWYITTDGRVFNATGYPFNSNGEKRTYFNSMYYQKGNLPATNGNQKNLASKIANHIVNDLGFEVEE